MQRVRQSKFLRVGDDSTLLFGACSGSVVECQSPASKSRTQLRGD